MAEFSSSGVTNPTPNILANIPQALLTGQKLQSNALANISSAQDLTDRATFRGSTAGMVARDPTATAQALGANPQAATSFLQTIPQMDANARQQFAADMAASGSLAGSILNAPPEQRAALWTQGRAQLIAGGHQNIPGETYPGDHAMMTMRGVALTAQEQLDRQAQMPTAQPVSPLQSIPGGGYVGPGGGQVGDGSVQQTGGTPNGPAGMAQSESSNNPAALSPLGYAGTYQMGTAALTDAGVYTPAPNENTKHNLWAGKFNIPGFPQVKSLSDYQANPAAQDAAYKAHIGVIDQAIAATPGADKFDPSSLEAVAHIGGVSGMRQWIATQGKYNPADANGTTLTDYANHFAGHDVGGIRSLAQQNGVGAVHGAVAQGGTIGPGGAVQIASNTNTAGAQPVASDVPQGVLPMAKTDGSPSPANGSFNAMLNGIRAPAPGSAQPGMVNIPASSQPPSYSGSNSAAPGTPLPANTPAFPQSLHDDTAGLNSYRPTSPGQPQNALANALTMTAGGGVQPGTAPASAPNALAGLAAPGAIGADPTMKPSFYGTGYRPVPEMPGYVYGRNAQGQIGITRLPGAPPPKGIETKFQGGSMVQTDPTTGAVVRVVPNMVPDSSRMTQVQGTNSDGRTGTLMYQDGKQVGFVPASTQGAQVSMMQADQGRATQAAQQASDAEQQVQRALEARNYAKGLPTGAGGEDRAALSTYLKTYAPDSVYQGFVRSGWLPDAPQAEAAAKVMLSQAAQDEKTMGGSGGLGLTEKYAKANPSLNMTPPAIQAMSNLKAVTAQAALDYGNGLLQHFNQNSQGFLNNQGTYVPVSAYDQAWHSGRNAQTYMAAVDAMNGKPYADWSQGLQPADRQRALGIIQRVDPNARPLGANGKPLDLSGQSAPAAGGGQPSPAGGGAASGAPTATGPNGQRLILRNGAWAPL